MPRVLWIHQNFVDWEQAGNARAVHLLQAFRDVGWHVDLICSRETYLGDRLDTAPGRELRESLTIHRVECEARGVAREQRGRSYLSFGRAALRRALELPAPDLVYASSPPLPQILPSLWAALRARRPLVLEVRDLWPAFLIEGGLVRSRALELPLRALEALAYRSADHVISVSPGFVPYLSGMGIPPDRITIAPTGVARSLGEADRAEGEAWRAANGLTGRPIVLYAGSFNEAYDLPRLLEAARCAATRVPDAVWVFAGNGRARDQVEAAARAHAHVRYLGSLPKASLRPVLLAADVAINAHADWPLLDLTLTGKLFDALAAGVPVVSFRDGTMGLLLRRAGAGTVVRGPSAADVVGAVAALLAIPPEERRATGDRARAWALQHLAADELARGIVQAVAPLVGLRVAPKTRRALTAMLGALSDVLRARDRQALARVRGDAKGDALRDAFDGWLARPSPSVQPTFPSAAFRGAG